MGSERTIANSESSKSPEESSIRKMLKEDFAEAALSYRREHDVYPEDIEFLEDLSSLENYLPVQDYFEKAAQDVLEEKVG